jgi:hypothetical protein
VNDLIALALLAYALSSSDEDALHDAIQEAILMSMVSAYNRWALLVGAVSVLQPDKQQIAQQAQSHADSIVATYTRDLGNATTTYLQVWQQANGTLDGVEGPLSQMLGDWTTARLQYKSAQIAGYETGCGAGTGTTQFIQDLLSGDLIDATTGEVLSPDDYGIGVIPAESSSDLCKEFAGRLFSLDEIDSIPDFPIHANCPHELIIVPLQQGV